MERHLITHRPGQGLHIEGFPNAERVVRLTGPHARRLAALCGHLSDLQFTHNCLHAINRIANDDHVVREALWHSALVHFAKCFTDSAARGGLSGKRVYKGDTEGQEVLRYYLHLRNKNIVHDENSFTQMLPGAIVNNPDQAERIDQVVCVGVTSSVLGQEDWARLLLLTQKAIAWTEAEVDGLCAFIKAGLASKTYDELRAMPPIEYKKPGAADVSRARELP